MQPPLKGVPSRSSVAMISGGRVRTGVGVGGAAPCPLPAANEACRAPADTGVGVPLIEARTTGSPAGTPLAFVFRRVLEECTTVAEAEALLRSEKATTWMNLAVCDHDRSAVFEITPTHVGRRDADHGVLACTNHFRTAGLAADTDCWRYPRLANAANRPPLAVEAVRQRLHAANQGHLTLQTMVFEPRGLALHLAIGEPPTSDDALTRIELAPLFHPEPDGG